VELLVNDTHRYSASWWSRTQEGCRSIRSSRPRSRKMSEEPSRRILAGIRKGRPLSACRSPAATTAVIASSSKCCRRTSTPAQPNRECGSFPGAQSPRGETLQYRPAASAPALQPGDSPEDCRSTGRSIASGRCEWRLQRFARVKIDQLRSSSEAWMNSFAKWSTRASFSDTISSVTGIS